MKSRMLGYVLKIHAATVNIARMTNAASPARPASHFGAYWQLTKPRVVALIVFTAIVGMLLAVPGLPLL